MVRNINYTFGLKSPKPIEENIPFNPRKTLKAHLENELNLSKCKFRTNPQT